MRWGGYVISLSHKTNSGSDLIKWNEKDDDSRSGRIINIDSIFNHHVALLVKEH